MSERSMENCFFLLEFPDAKKQNAPIAAVTTATDANTSPCFFMIVNLELQ